jgi:hypothetical protein
LLPSGIPATRQGMHLHQRPSGPLHAHVESLWYAERGALPHTRERCLPTGCADIVVPLLQEHVIRYDGEHDTHARQLRGAIVQGPFDRFGVRGTEGPSAVVGVHFTPGGAAAFFGGALPALRNRTELLEDLWGASARELRERLQAAASPQRALQLLHEYLLQRLRDAAPPDPLADFAVAAFHRDPASARVEPVQRASGCTPAQFIADRGGRRLLRSITPDPRVPAARGHGTRRLRAGAGRPADARGIGTLEKISNTSATLGA